MNTRLAILCSIFGWSGGTIHQAQREAEDCLEEDLDILALSDEDFVRVCTDLKQLYPSYSSYQRELTIARQ